MAANRGQVQGSSLADQRVDDWRKEAEDVRHIDDRWLVPRL